MRPIGVRVLFRSKMLRLLSPSALQRIAREVQRIPGVRRVEVAAEEGLITISRDMRGPSGRILRQHLLQLGLTDARQT